ncbi:NAD-dependent dehydratase [archaeon]|nr:NAD-dependent dehydratase [archaeon]
MGDNKNKKILVTGAGGYIGSVLVRLLLNEGWEVTALDRFHFGEDTLPTNDNLHIVKDDIRTVDAKVIKGHYAVIDLAAISNDPSGELSPTTTVSINHLGRFRMASLAKSLDVKRYIFPSSASVYGFQKGILSETSSVNPLTTYAQANLNAEKDVLSLADDNFIVTILRQSTVFGSSPRMRFDLAINGMVKGFLENGLIPILKDGTQWRPFIHVTDTARIMIMCLIADSNKIQQQIFNVGSSENNYQIFDLAKNVAVGLNMPFRYRWYGDPDHRSYNLNFDKIKKVLGFEPTHNAVSGARDVLDAIKNGDVDPHSPKTITVNWYKDLIKRGIKL